MLHVVRGVLAAKAVKQNIQPTDTLLSLLESFRRMVNEAVMIGLEKNITLRLKLCKEIYRDYT